MNPAWERVYESGADYVDFLGGVAWHEGKPPGVFHACRAQTRGVLGGDYIERCRCGAFRQGEGAPWADRNQTRRDWLRAKLRSALPVTQVECSQCGTKYDAIIRSAQAAERLCTRCWAEVFMRQVR